MTRRDKWLVLILSGLAVFCAGMLLATAAGEGYTAGRCRTLSECYRAIDWHRAQERKLREHQWDTLMPKAREAAFLAARVYPGVDPWAMLRVARCEVRGTARLEDRRRVHQRNKATAQGWLQFIDSTWNDTPFAAFDRDNVYIEALAAAQIVQQEGWAQWSCKP